MIRTSKQPTLSPEGLAVLIFADTSTLLGCFAHKQKSEGPGNVRLWRPGPHASLTKLWVGSWVIWCDVTVQQG